MSERGGQNKISVFSLDSTRVPLNRKNKSSNAVATPMSSLSNSSYAASHRMEATGEKAYFEVQVEDVEETKKSQGSALMQTDTP